MPNRDYERVEKIIRYLEAHFKEQPSLGRLAAEIHLSPFHFQRLFKRWAGISPKKFLERLTVENVKKRLLSSRSVLDAAYESGLSGPGRLHDLMVAAEAMTPGEYKRAGEGIRIRYGFHSSPFGEALVAVTPRGLCGLSFVDAGKRERVLRELRGRWPKAAFHEDGSGTKGVLGSVFGSPGKGRERNLPLLLKGTPFQLKVWEALLRIPVGSLAAYQTIAEVVGKPRASRAVGSAVGRNPIAYLIPCHRVIRETGNLGNYKWGSARKKAILAREATAR